MFGIVANVISDHAFRVGAKVRIAALNGNPSSVEVTGLSKSGRKITKYIQFKRLENFRAAFIPEHQRKNLYIYWNDKDAANAVAKDIATLWKDVRFFHRDGTLLRDGITESEAFKRFKDDPNYKWRHISPLSFLEQRIDQIRKESSRCRD
jgi:hypothetical protein